MEVKKTNIGKIRIKLSCKEGFIDVKKNSIWIDLEIDKANSLCIRLVAELEKRRKIPLALLNNAI